MLGEDGKDKLGGLVQLPATRQLGGDLRNATPACNAGALTLPLHPRWPLFCYALLPACLLTPPLLLAGLVAATTFLARLLVPSLCWVYTGGPCTEAALQLKMGFGSLLRLPEVSTWLSSQTGKLTPLANLPGLAMLPWNRVSQNKR